MNTTNNGKKKGTTKEELRKDKWTKSRERNTKIEHSVEKKCAFT